MSTSGRDRRTINLALQGGGAHGAFTWGVLDALLEDGRLGFEALSGTSAGAMNAVALAHGMLEGGNDGARAALERFWMAIADAMPLASTVSANEAQRMVVSPAYRSLLRWANFFSPERLNPYDRNPLRDIIVAQFDFARLREHGRIKLFVAATHANSGKLRIFATPEISPEAVLASACLPTMNRAVEIDGEPYWDGGYAANPAVFPLFYDCRAFDILLVLLSPLRHSQTPQTVEEIRERVLEFTFTSSFLREMQMFARLREHFSGSMLPMGRFERRIGSINFHLIDAEDFLGDLTPETRLIANRPFFVKLKDRGRERARRWLDAHFADLGKRSSVEIADLFN